MFTVLGSILLFYIVMTLLLSARRIFKIVDLHHEFTFVRSKEQKIHVKVYALNLRNDMKNDLIWPVSLFKAIKSAFAWLKTSQ